MEKESIPRTADLRKIYGADGEAAATQRYKEVCDKFRDRFGTLPDLVARSPGRVNLIGEHIDYEGYGVLPMALNQDTIIALRRLQKDADPAKNTLTVANVDAAKYPEKSYSAEGTQAVDTSNHFWANYFIAAYKGVYEFLHAKGALPQGFGCGLQLLVHGQVPTGSGLSSSSAFVCSSALAILGALDLDLSKGEVATFTAACEMYVGTQSGGMDQAISIMGKPGFALLIDFHPVRADDVKLPEGATFVIANSLAESLKAETADKYYNMRVVECRLAAIALALAHGVPPEEAASDALDTLSKIERRLEGQLQAEGGTMVGAVKAALHAAPYSQAELEGLLGRPLAPLLKNSHQQRVLALAQGLGFKLRQRALHVYQEAARVLAFRETCRRADLGQDAKLAELGALMNASQDSCREMYECSCPDLDELVRVASGAGALGARLTGAGWGGCTVSLVPATQADHFVEEVTRLYYSNGRAVGKDLSQVIFASRPASGGAIFNGVEDLYA